MAIGLAPVHNATTVRRVDLVVDRAKRRASAGDSHCLEFGKNRIKARIIHPKTEMLHGQFALDLVEIQRESLIYINRAEWPRPGI
jgi:hypothetical protein